MKNAACKTASRFQVGTVHKNQTLRRTGFKRKRNTNPYEARRDFPAAKVLDFSNRAILEL